MNARQLLLSFLMFITIYSIKAQNAGLKNDKMIRQQFTEAEIENLEMIIDHFEHYLISLCKEPEIENCYNNYFKYLASFEKKGDLRIEIPKHVEIDLLNAMDDTFINEIWLNGCHVKQEKSKRDFLFYNKKGKYIRFLENLATTDKKINHYLDMYQGFSDFSPTLITGTIKSFENSKINDPKLRLFIAVHYFSINLY